jgi:hypothetical protein
MQKKLPGIKRPEENFIYSALTFPLLFAITSSAIFVGAGA